MNLATVKSLKKKDTDLQLRAYIAESVREVLDDPDFGLELSETTKQCLHRVQTRPRKYIPLAAVLKQYRSHA